MFITRNSDQRCCTCQHWQGIRVTELDGHIYSLKNVEGICRSPSSLDRTDAACLSLSLPQDSCIEWAQWDDLHAPNAVPAEQANTFGRFSPF